MRTRLCAVVALLASGVALANGEILNPNTTGLNPQAGGPALIDDRLRVTDLSASHQETDLIIRTGIGDLNVTRTFSSNYLTFIDGVVRESQWFGVSPQGAFWWSSFASSGFEFHDVPLGGDELPPYLDLREPSGELIHMDLPRTILATTTLDAPSGNRLIVEPGAYASFTFVKPGVGQYVYSPWNVKHVTITGKTMLLSRNWRLESVLGSVGDTPICRVNYESAANPGQATRLTCFGGINIEVVWAADRSRVLGLTRTLGDGTQLELVRYGYDSTGALTSAELSPNPESSSPGTWYSYGNWDGASAPMAFSVSHGSGAAFPRNVVQDTSDQIDGAGRHYCDGAGPIPYINVSYNAFYNVTTERTGEGSSTFAFSSDDSNCKTGSTSVESATPSGEHLVRSYLISKETGFTNGESIACRLPSGAPCSSISSATAEWVEPSIYVPKRADALVRDFRNSFTVTDISRYCARTGCKSNVPSVSDGPTATEVLSRSSCYGSRSLRGTVPS